MYKNRKTPWPTTAGLELAERRAGVITGGIGLYKLLFVLFVGSFLGVAVEVLWCVLENGAAAGRAGLVWGPFNLLYGIGAVAMTVVLYPLRHRSWWVLLLGGMLVGTVVEYACSWWQEMTFGSRSWNYAHQPFNLGGRVCLLFSVFWGILGIIWIKSVYVPLALWLTRLPARAVRVTAWTLTAFLAVNALVTFAAVARWSERLEGHAPDGAWETLLDERFPDDRMTHIFNNMRFS